MSEEETSRNSPLEGLVYKDGVPMEIRIRQSPGHAWRLEVIDDHGRIVTWQQAFQSDQEAYDEAIRAISREGASWVIAR